MGTACARYSREFGTIYLVRNGDARLDIEKAVCIAAIDAINNVKLLDPLGTNSAKSLLIFRIVLGKCQIKSSKTMLRYSS